MSKVLNENSYNKVIDQCNENDERIAEFFNSIVINDLDKIKTITLADPVIAYEVNDHMENVLHLAVALNHYDIVAYLLTQTFGPILANAKDIKK